MQMLGFGFGGFDLTHMEMGLVFWSAFVVVTVVELGVLRGDICIGFTVTDWTPIIFDNQDMIMSSVLVIIISKTTSGGGPGIC